MIRKKRKMEHLHLANSLLDGPGSNGFGNVHLIHDSVPELAMEEIDLSYTFLDKELNFPLLINALTGGTDQARRINRLFSQMAEKHGLAMAVGSQTIAIEDPGLRDSFTVVRDVNPDGVVVANLSALSSIDNALEAVKMISADALQLHFNVPQELAMFEGDRDFRGVVDNVKRIIDSCPVPIIAKEVGFGFSRESVSKLYDAGIRIFDNSGCGGTNFVAIEDERRGMFDRQLDDWGIPTAVSLAEILDLKLSIQIIASGGIRTAADTIKAISMGADLAGITGLFLKILLNEGAEELDKRIEAFLYQLRAVSLMTGSRNYKELKEKPLVIEGATAEWLRARAVDPRVWSRSKL